MSTIAKIDASTSAVITKGQVSKELFPFIAKANDMHRDGKTLAEFEASLPAKVKTEWSNLCQEYFGEYNTQVTDSNYNSVLDDCEEIGVNTNTTQAPQTSTKKAVYGMKDGKPIHLVTAGTKPNLAVKKGKFTRNNVEMNFVGKVVGVQIETVLVAGGKTVFKNTGRAFKAGQYDSLGQRNYTLAFLVESPFGEKYNTINKIGGAGTGTMNYRVDQLLNSDPKKKNKDFMSVVYRSVVPGGMREKLSEKATLDVYAEIIDELVALGVNGTMPKIVEDLYVSMQCEERLAGVTMYEELLSEITLPTGTTEADFITGTRVNRDNVEEQTILAYHTVDNYEGVEIRMELNSTLFDTNQKKYNNIEKRSDKLNTLAEIKEMGLLDNDGIAKVLIGMLAQ